VAAQPDRAATELQTGGPYGPPNGQPPRPVASPPTPAAEPQGPLREAEAISLTRGVPIPQPVVGLPEDSDDDAGLGDRSERLDVPESVQPLPNDLFPDEGWGASPLLPREAVLPMYDNSTNRDQTVLDILWTV